MVIKLNSNNLYEAMHGRDPAWPNGLDKNMRLYAYNGLDSAVTLRVHHGLAPKLAASPHALLSYTFVRNMQGPALAMMLRGVMINKRVRADETERYQAIRAKAQARLDTMANAIWGPETYTEVTKTKELWTPVGKRGQPLFPRFRTVRHERSLCRPRGLNPNSNRQVLAFFNIALDCPVRYELRKLPTGTVRTPTANNKALAAWAKIKSKGPGIDRRDRSEHYLHFAQPFVSLILTIRDADKMLGVLRSPLEPNGRMSCSYNVVGTENGRWNSHDNAFGRGTNLQNITPTMRRMFCADDGFRMASTDLEQAESRLVAALVWQVTGDDTYWRACESVDLHTTVCQMSWPELGWTADLAANRAIAEQPYPGLRGKFTYRDVAKRLGHGSNYDGSAFGIAGQVGVPVNIVEDFQARYFTAFPAIREWHKWVKAQIMSVQHLDTPLGRRRWFFGRPNDPATHREAIAFTPQSTIGELLNLALLRVYHRTLLPKPDPLHLPVQLLLQNHDAFLFQFPNSLDPAPILASVKSELEIPIPFVRGDEVRHLVIPGEFVTGWNWAYKDKDPDQDTWKFTDGNPDGLAKWKGRDDRVRQQRAATSAADWLDRPASSLY